MNTLDGCRGDVIDVEAYDEILERQSCAATYCGAGECVATAAGPGCLCDPGFVARTYTDLDGERSVTCVPEIGTVDLGANNLPLPNVCSGVTTSAGTCIDVNGFPSLACNSGYGAVLDGDSELGQCSAILRVTGTRGATDYTAAVTELAVCSPEPGQCGEWGWLVPNQDKLIQGVVCDYSMPDHADTVPGPAPTCQDIGMLPLPVDEMLFDDEASGGCGCVTVGNDGEDPLALLIATSLLGLAISRRRRRR